MHAPGQVERVWARRLRWRMRGAWQWPAFAALTLLDAVLLTRLPFYDEGPGTFVAGVLVAMFFNLLAVAVVGPLLGLRLRRMRPDLPRVIASDYASTAVLGAITTLMLAGGLLHRPAVAAEHADVAAVAASTHDYVVRQAPFTTAHLLDEDVEVDFSQVTTPQDRVAVIATLPLTDNEQWTVLDKGEMAVFRDGERIALA